MSCHRPLTQARIPSGRPFRRAVGGVLGFCLTAGAADLLVPNPTVGKNLETEAVIRLTEPAGGEGLQVTVTSSDPNRLRFSLAPDRAGSGSILIPVRTGSKETREFWVQALTDRGDVGYSVTAPGVGTKQGKVTMAASGFVIAGPGNSASVQTTPRSRASTLTVFSVALDSSWDLIEPQPVAGGIPVQVSITSSNPLVGSVASPQITFNGGTGAASTDFQPRSEGDVDVMVAVPKGYNSPARRRSVAIAVHSPKMALLDQVRLGKNLEVKGSVVLGEAAPEGGLRVTLTSQNPRQLLLSPSATEVGAESITLAIPAGGLNAPYYLQALDGSGEVTYMATAPGYTPRTATVALTPSGVMVTPQAYGPPDEAEVLRANGSGDPRGFAMRVSTQRQMALAVWTVQLDPKTKRGADITTQPLRAGMSITVDLSSSNPNVGTVGATATLSGGSEYAVVDFTARTPGSTIITASTPPGFITPENSNRLPAIVSE